MRKALENLSSLGDAEPSALARAIGSDAYPIATEPRANLSWMLPNVFDPPAEGGTCSVITPEGDCWVGKLVERIGRRVRVRLFGSNVLATFVGCNCAVLRPHSRADARQIFERQRSYRPAASFPKKEKSKMKDEHDDTDDDRDDDTATEAARHAVGFRLGADHLSADRFRSQPETV